MEIDIISCQPDLLTSFFSFSIIKRAISSNKVKINVHDLRDYSNDKHKKIDDYQYGGKAGLVMTVESIDECISEIKKNKKGEKVDEIIYMAPDGELFTQKVANELSLRENIVILCGHYKGIDERIRENIVTREISIGEYVLSGGEIPACVIVDSIVRLIPGVLNDGSSALEDSFQNDMIAPPVYSRPEIYKGWAVPKILLSGNEKKINEWLMEESIKRTKAFREKIKKTLEDMEEKYRYEE